MQLGRMHLTGALVQRDPTKAAAHLRKANSSNPWVRDMLDLAEAPPCSVPTCGDIRGVLAERWNGFRWKTAIAGLICSLEEGVYECRLPEHVQAQEAKAAFFEAGAYVREAAPRKWTFKDAGTTLTLLTPAGEEALVLALSVERKGWQVYASFMPASYP